MGKFVLISLGTISCFLLFARHHAGWYRVSVASPLRTGLMGLLLIILEKQHLQKFCLSDSYSKFIFHLENVSLFNDYFSSAFWIRIRRLLESFGEILPLSNTGTIIETGEHAHFSIPLYNQGAVTMCCFKSLYLQKEVCELGPVSALRIATIACLLARVCYFPFKPKWLAPTAGFCCYHLEVYFPQCLLKPSFGRRWNSS